MKLDWAKGDGLLPAIVQHADTGVVLMLGFMNEAALDQTIASRRVTFFSRTKARLWTKGETSGHWLELDSIHADCDADTLLLLARPAGPVCHTGAATCFPDAARAFLPSLDALIAQRERERPAGSYTTKLFDAGVRRIAQKVGEEGVETALAGAAGDGDEVCEEAADLLYHLGVLLHAKGRSFADVMSVLTRRAAERAS